MVYDWSRQDAWSPGAWSPGAWSTGAFAAGTWHLIGPKNTVQPAVTGLLTQGSVLSCSTGTWTSSFGVPTYSYQWMRGTKPIAGATASTYTLALADSQQPISC